jgi:hypothetical protein
MMRPNLLGVGLIILCAGALGVISLRWTPGFAADGKLDEKQQAILNRLFVRSSSAVISLDLRGQQLTDNDLETIASFEHLQQLDLSETNVRDGQLRFLKKLWNLRTLRLNKTKLTNAAIPHLEELPALTELEVHGSEILALAIGELQRREEGTYYLRERNRAARNRVRYVSVPLNRFLLLRLGKVRIALQFTKVTGKSQGGAEYVCCWQPAPEGPFASESLKTLKGEVFEKYHYEKQKDGSSLAINDGGNLLVDCGPLKLRWSTKTIVYLPGAEDPDEPPLEVALTTWTTPKEIDFQGQGLRWSRGPLTDYRGVSRAPEEPFYLGHVVRASLGRFVLLRRGNDRMALKLVRSPSGGDSARRYVCYWQTDAEAPFSEQKSLKKSEGELVEKRRVVKKEGKTTWLEDAGSKLRIDCGPLQLGWSSSAYLYYPEMNGEAVALEMADTTWKTIDEIDFQMKGLRWHKKK